MAVSVYAGMWFRLLDMAVSVYAGMWFRLLLTGSSETGAVHFNIQNIFFKTVSRSVNSPAMVSKQLLTANYRFTVVATWIAAAGGND